MIQSNSHNFFMFNGFVVKAQATTNTFGFKTKHGK